MKIIHSDDSLKDVPIKQKASKERSERGGLIEFFIEHLTDRKGKAYKPAYLNMRLAHLNNKDLYYLKSVYTDIKNRNGQVSAQKYFWWSITHKNDKPNNSDFTL